MFRDIKQRQFSSCGMLGLAKTLYCRIVCSALANTPVHQFSLCPCNMRQRIMRSREGAWSLVSGLKYCFSSNGVNFFIFILQTLAECKQRPAFSRLLKLYEEKAVCCGRTIENYLTAPMHRVSNQEIVKHSAIQCFQSTHAHCQEHSAFFDFLTEILHFNSFSYFIVPFLSCFFFTFTGRRLYFGQSKPCVLGHCWPESVSIKSSPYMTHHLDAAIRYSQGDIYVVWNFFPVWFNLLLNCTNPKHIYHISIALRILLMTDSAVMIVQPIRLHHLHEYTGRILDTCFLQGLTFFRSIFFY